MVVCIPCLGFGVRHLQYLLFAALITIEYWMQEITMKTFLRNVTAGGVSEESTDDHQPISPAQLTQTQQLAYLCFAIGRLVSGFASLKVNNKYLLIIFIVFESIVATTCYWFILQMSFFAVMLGFAGLGFSRAFHWTLVMNILAKWMPPNEFTTASTIIIVTREFFSMMIKFFINTITTFEPTRRMMLVVMTFYIGWIFVYLVLGAEGPETSFLLSKIEHAHLAKHIGPRKKTRCSSKVPWKSMFKTILLYGWLIADFGRECSVTMIADGFHIGLEDIEVAPVAGIQVGACFVYAAIMACGVLSDRLIMKELLTQGQVRKIYSSVGCCGASISMILAAYSENPSPKFAFLIVGQIFSCVMAIGQPVSLFDISPNYAALIFSIFTFVRCVLFALKIFIDSKTGLYPLKKDNFDMVFYRYGFVVFMTNLIFLLCGDIERKPFDAYDTADWTKESIISYP